MNITQALILGLIQGITEFLPISSSGHLIIAENLMRLKVDALKSFDIAVHFGTLLAILFYFRKDFARLIEGFFWQIGKKIGLKSTQEAAQKNEPWAKLSGWLIAGTMPAVLVGFFFSDYLDAQFRNGPSVAVTMILVGTMFFVAEYVAAKAKKNELNLKHAVLIGVAQALALIPGVSRSGATIASGIALGLKRETAAKFSFWLGAVAIAAASLYSLLKTAKGDLPLPPFDILSAGIITSFLSGYAAIIFLMQFLKKHTLLLFGVYRVVFGFTLLYTLL